MHQGLNVATKWYPENADSGLMICGINWGGEESSDTREYPASFFSDHTVNCYPYRDRLLVWFRLFGHRLETDAGKEGGFERSIVQTNWLNTQSPNMRGKLLYNECLNSWENMERHLVAIKPRLIIFLSVSLLDVLNSPELSEKVKECLGPAKPPRHMRKEVFSAGTDRFYILEWLTLRDILIRKYKAYLKRKNGVRPRRFDSFHTAINEDQLEKFRDNWSIINHLAERAA